MDMTAHGELHIAESSVSQLEVSVISDVSTIPEREDSTSPRFDMPAFTHHLCKKRTIGDDNNPHISLELFPRSPALTPRVTKRKDDIASASENTLLRNEPLSCQHCGVALRRDTIISPPATTELTSSAASSPVCKAALELTYHPVLKRNVGVMRDHLLQVMDYVTATEAKYIGDLDFRYAAVAASYALRNLKDADSCDELCRTACVLLVLLQHTARNVSVAYGNTVMSWMHEIGVCKYDVTLGDCSDETIRSNGYSGTLADLMVSSSGHSV